jgi:hypothetical protein
MSHVNCPWEVTLANGETCVFNPQFSERRINILWLFIIDECRYDCENGFMTVTYWRLFGITVRKRSSRPLA